MLTIALKTSSKGFNLFLFFTIILKRHDSLIHLRGERDQRDNKRIPVSGSISHSAAALEFICDQLTSFTRHQNPGGSGSTCSDTM